VEREREREARQELSCLARRWPLARLPGTTLLWSPTASRSRENGGLQIGREREKRERENGKERDREWMGEYHERGKKKHASGIACGTVQREST
jgi:hypothetical protein